MWDVAGRDLEQEHRKQKSQKVVINKPRRYWSMAVVEYSAKIQQTASDPLITVNVIASKEIAANLVSKPKGNSTRCCIKSE